VLHERFLYKQKYAINNKEKIRILCEFHRTDADESSVVEEDKNASVIENIRISVKVQRAWIFCCFFFWFVKLVN
jgi:hypothetical protein